MRLKAPCYYQLLEEKKSVFVYYIIMISIVLISFLTSFFYKDAYGTFNINGIDACSCIFLFILGMNSFKENFGMAVQNGISRKTFFASQAITTIVLAFILSVCDRILLYFSNFLELFNGRFEIDSIFGQIPFANIGESSQVLLEIQSFLFDFGINMAAIAAGLLISLLFYRLNKLGKILIGAGIPVIFFIILPIVDATFAGGRIFFELGKLLGNLQHYLLQSSYHTILSLILLFLVCNGFYFLLIRRVIVREV